MTSALVDLSGLIDPGWQPVGAVGYYVHRGHVYLAGVLATLRGPVGGITDPSAPPAGRTLIATLPEAIRPTVPIHASLPVDPENTTDAGTPVLNLPTSPYAVTVDPSGTISLDAAPPDQVNTTPDPSVYFYYLNFPGAHAQWGAPLALALGLASLSWRVALLGDTFTPEPLGPFLHAAHFADIDSGFFIHGERIHLTGSVTAAVDGAQILLDSLPPGTDAGLPGTGVVAITDGPGQNVMYVRGGGDLEVSLDEIVPLKPSGQSPPLSTYSPPPSVDDGVGEGNFITQDPSGFATGADTEIGVIHDAYDVDPGFHLCDLGHGFGNKRCPNNGPVPSFSFDISDLLVQLRPTPAWFLLTLFFQVSTGSDHTGTQGWGSNGCVLPGPLPDQIGDCADSFNTMRADPGFTLAGAAGLANNDGTPFGEMVSMAVGDGAWGTGVGGHFVLPPTSLYEGAAEIAGSPADVPVESLWWRSDQVGVITVGFAAGIGGTDGLVGSAPGGVEWYALIRPGYERRQMGLHAGDVLTLEGSGWPGVLSAPGPPVGSINTGSAAAGIVPRALR